MFDEKRLARDILSALSALCANRPVFVGHDGRRYTIVGRDETPPEAEVFVDVMVTVGDREKIAGKYAITLQKISR